MIQDRPLLDLQTLSVLETFTAPEPIDHLLELFVSELRRHGSGLARALESADLEGMRFAAHSVKGGAASFGATRLQHAATALEESCKGGTVEGVERLARELPFLIEASIHALGEIYGYEAIPPA